MAYARADDLPVHVFCTTARCEARCPWDPQCRGAAGRDLAPEDRATPRGPWRARLRGGNPFRYGELSRWAAWARSRGAVFIEVEGPAHGLAVASARARLLAARPDRVILSAPTLEPEALERWTRCRGLGVAIERTLAAATELGVPVVARIPVYAPAVEALPRTVAALRDHLGPEVPIRLCRVPVGGWDELEGLAAAIEALPADARVTFDREQGYAPCLLPGLTPRPGLFCAARGDEPGGPGLTPCAGCAWRPRCAFRCDREPPPLERMRPLDRPSALALQRHAEELSVSHVPGVSRWDRASVELPDLVCFAPFTSLVATDPTVPAVPCALSWVRTAMSDEEIAEQTGLPVARVRELNARSRERWGYPHFTPMNEDLSLSELWNSPLMLLMRRQMGRGGPTDRCRPMCRVLLGVEEREVDSLARPDAQLEDAVAANRRRLLDEIREGRERLEARPLKLVYGVSSRCNITCSFCVGPQGEYGELSERRLEQIQQLLPTLMNLDVIGPGEPLMSVRFPRLLAHIAERGYPSLDVSITTNGTLVTPRWVRRHEGVRWGNLRLSLNAGSAATHERMTGKRMFERVIGGIEALVEQRERTGRPTRVTLSCVLSELILGDLANFAAIAHRYGADIVLEPMNGDRQRLSPYTRRESLARLRDECRELAVAYELDNPAISRAFAAMVGFAEQRLRTGQLTVLPHH